MIALALIAMAGLALTVSLAVALERTGGILDHAHEAETF